jgi:Ran GTPase-activating protein (RanGAP) involved in mRNA processing and transport
MRRIILTKLEDVPEDALGHVTELLDRTTLGRFAMSSNKMRDVANSTPLRVGCSKPYANDHNFEQQFRRERREYNLTRCIGNPNQLEFLLAYLAANSTVTHVNILENNLNEADATRLLAIKDTHPNIRTLCGIHPKQTKLEVIARPVHMNSQDIRLIASELNAHVNLTKLDIPHYKIGTAGAEALGAALKANTTLEIVNLGTSNLGGDPGYIAVISGLKENRSVRQLQICNEGLESMMSDQPPTTALRSDALVALKELLMSNTTLQSLDISNNRINGEGAAFIADALRANRTLTALRADYNPFGTDGTRHIVDAIASADTISTLSLAGVGAPGAGDVIARYVRSSSALQNLDLSHNRLESEALIDALHARSPTPPFLYLGFSGHRLDEIAMARLLSFHVRKLNLDAKPWARLSDHGSRVIAEALKENPVLTDLSIRYTNFGAVGGEALASALRRNDVLTRLDMYACRVGTGGGVAIAKALKFNQTLTWLSFNGVDLGEEGGKALAESLKFNKTLRYLDIHATRITDSGAVALATSMRHNRSLTELGFDSLRGYGLDATRTLVEALYESGKLGNKDPLFKVYDEGGQRQIEEFWAKVARRFPSA